MSVIRLQWPIYCSPRLFILIFLIWTPRLATGQETCNKDIVDFEGVSGRSVLVDGVATFETVSPRLLQCDTELIAARGTQISDTEFRFEGDVRIVELGDTVYADVVLYHSDTKIGKATGNVKITDGRMVLSAPEATFYTEEKRTVFSEGVLYEDSTTVLESSLGTYWSDIAHAEFSSHVRLWQSQLYVEADSIAYWRDDEVTRGQGNVYVERIENDESVEITERPDTMRPDTTRAGRDASDRISVFGDTVYHNAQSDSSLLTGDVLMLRAERDSSGVVDSLFVSAERMTILLSEESDRVIAVRSVDVVQGSLSVSGDSLVYDRRESLGDEAVTTQMFGSPMAWLKQTQISSDSLWMTGLNGAVDTLRATGNVFVAEFDSTLNRIQQLKGKTLLGLFEQDTLRTMTVAPNAEALYYVEAEEKNEQAAVHSSADRIVFTFDAGSVVDVRSYQGVAGTFYPASIINQAENLEGFLWSPERRPLLLNMRLQWTERLRRHQSRDM